MMNASDTLDEGDCRVVAALQVHPRAGCGEIGRILGEHERTVARRIQRLTGSGMVRPTALYDVMRCGLGSSVHVRLEVDTGASVRVAKELIGRGDFRGVITVSGRGNVLWCEVILPPEQTLHSLMQDGIPGISAVRRLDAYVTLRTFTTVAEWHAPLLSEQERRLLRESAVQPISTPADRYPISPTDQRVAKALIRNARISLTSLAKELDFSVATAGRRVTALLERQMVYLRTEIEPALLGLRVEAQLCLKVRPAGIEAVGTALAALPEVRYCAAITGAYNLLVEVCLKHEADLYRFLGERLAHFADITEVDTELITHAYKRGSVIKDGTFAHGGEGH